MRCDNLSESKMEKSEKELAVFCSVFQCRDLVRTLSNEFCPWDNCDCAFKGLLRVLQHRHEFGTSFRWTPWVMHSAAWGGWLNIVKWLHEKREEGCTTWTINYAAAHGHLDVVEWLQEYRKEGCRSEAIRWAKMWGNFHIAEWLENHPNKI